jgi:hypothetical protein
MKLAKELRSYLLILVFLLGVILCVGVIAVFDGRIFSGEMHATTRKGEVLSLMHSSYGPFTPYRPESFRRWLVDHLPISKKRKFNLAMEMGTTMQSWRTGDSSQDALWFWLALKSIQTSGNTNMRYYMELVDQYGWVYPDSGYHAFFWQNVVPNMGVGAFQNFPRHESELNLRVYNDQGECLGAFTLNNPDVIEAPATESATALPQSQMLGSSEVILEGIELLDTESPVFIEGGETLASRSMRPRLTFSDQGQESWELVDMTLRDPHGNLATSHNFGTIIPSIKPLSPYRSAWHWTLSFVDTGNKEHSSTYSKVWNIAHLTVPDPGVVVPSDLEKRLGEVTIKIVAVSGQGKTKYRYSENSATNVIRIDGFQAAENPFDEPWKVDFDPQSNTMQIDSTDVHLALEIEGLSGQQRISAQWLDETGASGDLSFNAGSSMPRQHLSRFKSKMLRHPPSNRSTRPQVYIPLQGAPVSGRVSLRFTVHEVVDVLYTFKPNPNWFPDHLNYRETRQSNQELHH